MDERWIGVIIWIVAITAVGSIGYAAYHNTSAEQYIETIKIHGIDITEYNEFIIHTDHGEYVSTNSHYNQVFLDYNNVNVTYIITYNDKNDLYGWDYSWIKSVKVIENE